ncbi:unnamed protein product, partial [Staurois parvus]
MEYLVARKFHGWIYCFTINKETPKRATAKFLLRQMDSDKLMTLQSSLH